MNTSVSAREGDASALLEGVASASGESPQRARLLALVRAAPGLPVGELLDRSGAGWGTLYYHLAILERSGMVRTVRDGRRRLVYPAGERESDWSKADGLIRGESVRELAIAIAEHPGGTIEDLIQRLDRSPRVVYYHTKRLIAAGLVVSSSSTRHRDLLPTPDLLRALQRQGVVASQVAFSHELSRKG